MLPAGDQDEVEVVPKHVHLIEMINNKIIIVASTRLFILPFNVLMHKILTCYFVLHYSNFATFSKNPSATFML